MQLPPRRHFEAERLAALQELERPLRKRRTTEAYRALLELRAKRAAREAGEEWTTPQAEGRP